MATMTAVSEDGLAWRKGAAAAAPFPLKIDLGRI